MSDAQQVEETNGDDEPSEPTKTEFFERIKLEGVTLQGDFYMPHGEGRQRRYYKYDPSAVNGFDAVRGDDREIEAQQVASHDTAHTEQVPKDHIEDVVFPKVRDGFGAFGLVEVESARDEDTPQPGDPDGREPMDGDEVEETIRQNHDKRGFFAEDDDGDQKVVSLAHPDAELMGYITGSHVKALPADGLTSVDDYRAAVVEAVGGEAGITKPGSVPIATDDMMETFEQAGNKLDKEDREKLSRQVEARWEDGEYDHLRKDDEDDGGS
jgi:hypothetical protein